MSDNGTTTYYYRNCVGGFFELPVEQAREVLPRELQPVELHHGMGVFSVMAFDFTESEVGAYQELILSVLVSPRVEPGAPMPHSAFYPVLLATTTAESRAHAIARWHLPHYMKDVEMSMTASGDELVVKAGDEHGPIVEMKITSYGWRQNEQNHQAFMKDDEGSFMASITMVGVLSESEEERGSLQIHAHPMTASLGDLDEITTTPFREMWMRDGVQTFQPLRVLSQTAGV